MMNKNCGSGLSWDSRQSESRSGAEVQLTDCWLNIKLLLKETSSFKHQNPGKFCLLVCSLCFCLAILAIYIPGVVLLHIMVLGIFLWPLVLSQEFGMWLEPVLQKLIFGIEKILQQIKESHDPDNRTEDNEVSSGGLTDFPSLDNCTGTNGNDEDLSFGLSFTFIPQNKLAHGTGVGNESAVSEAQNNITAADTAAIQEGLETVTAENTDSEAEEFELLDQSELENLEGELGLECKSGEPKPSDNKNAGFFFKLLGHQ